MGGKVMRKKLVLLLTTLLATATITYADNIEVEKGWNLLGSSCEVNRAEIDKPEIHTVWTWEGNYWKAYSPDENVQKILNAYGIPELNSVPKFKGFWIYATSKTSVNLCPGVATPPVPGGTQIPVVKEGLVAYYSFDHCDARDDSGNNYYGVITSHPGCVDGVAGKALKFDGVNDRIKIPAEILDGKETFTVNYWVNTTDAAYTTISGANSRQDNEFYIGDNNDGVKVSLYQTGYSSGTSVRDGNWHMVTVEVSPNIGLKIYIDGNETYSNEDISIEPFRIEGLWIGGDQDSVDGGWEQGQQFKGILDEVRFYDRLLTESEIQTLYRQGIKEE